MRKAEKIIPNTKLFLDDDWSNISLNSSMNVDVEFFVINGSAEIILETETKGYNIGYIHFRVYNSRQLSKYQLWDAADANSGDEEWLMSTFIELFEDELEEWSPKFLTLNTIMIESVYRSKGFGKEAIKQLIKLCSILEINYIVLKPSPFEDVDFNQENKLKRKKEIEKLVSFYDEIGFDSYYLENNEPIMVLDVSDIDFE